MEKLLNSINAVMVILLLTVTGYVMAARGLLKKDTKSFISKFLMMFVIPVNTAYSLRNSLDRSLLASYGLYLLAPLTATLLNLLASLALVFLFRIPKRRAGLFIMICTVSNAIFIGYPMCYELFGDASIPFLMLYFMVNTFFLNVVLTSIVRWTASGESFRLNSLLSLMKLPTVWAVFIGIGLIALDIRFPAMINSYLKYISNLVSPLAMILTGYIIWDIGFKSLKLDRDAILILLFRFVLSPALSILMCRTFGVEGLCRSVMVVEAAMPAVSQSVVTASEYGLDEGFAARMAAITTLGSFIEIPLLMMIL